MSSCSLQFPHHFVVSSSLVLLYLPAVRSLEELPCLSPLQSPCSSTRRTLPAPPRAKLPRPLCGRVGVQPLTHTSRWCPVSIITLLSRLWELGFFKPDLCLSLIYFFFYSVLTSGRHMCLLCLCAGCVCLCILSPSLLSHPSSLQLLNLLPAHNRIWQRDRDLGVEGYCVSLSFMSKPSPVGKTKPVSAPVEGEVRKPP